MKGNKKIDGFCSYEALRRHRTNASAIRGTRQFVERFVMPEMSFGFLYLVEG